MHGIGRSAIMHHDGGVARWRSVWGIRRPLATLQSPRRNRLARCWRWQIRIIVVHLVIVLPINTKVKITPW